MKEGCDTLPVNNIGTKAAVLAWIGDIPKYIPSVIFYFHLVKQSILLFLLI